jgi:hypothetical protein
MHARCVEYPLHVGAETQVVSGHCDEGTRSSSTALQRSSHGNGTDDGVEVSRFVAHDDSDWSVARQGSFSSGTQ